MDIMAGDMKTPGEFSIKDIRLSFEPGFIEPGTPESTANLWPVLHVALEPLPQRRERGYGASHQPRKNTAELRIHFGELQQMMAAVRDELRICYQVVTEEGLWDKVAEAKRKKQEGATE
jgi:hypothetical protein